MDTRQCCGKKKGKSGGWRDLHCNILCLMFLYFAKKRFYGHVRWWGILVSKRHASVKAWSFRNATRITRHRTPGQMFNKHPRLFGLNTTSWHLQNSFFEVWTPPDMSNSKRFFVLWTWTPSNTSTEYPIFHGTLFVQHRNGLTNTLAVNDTPLTIPNSYPETAV